MQFVIARLALFALDEDAGLFQGAGVMAEQVVAAGEADAVAFGQTFIANPDLPERFFQGSALNAPDPSTFYGEGPHGYVDYPQLARV